jgi:PBP1b-binding outer membrane lipoprotein LpoB
MTISTRTRTVIAGGLLAAMALAGCSSSEPEQQPTDTNMVEDTGVTESEAAAPTPVETAPVEVAPPPPAVVEPPRETPVAPDEQMLDDADATGMTARVTRDEEPTENEDAPQQ